MTLLAAVVIGWVCSATVAMALGMRPPFLRSVPARVSSSAARSTRRVEWLRQAGVHVTPSQFVCVSVVCGLISYVVLASFAGGVVAIVPAAAVACLPRGYYRRRRDIRLAAAQRAWPDALRELLTAVMSGQTLHQGLLGFATRGDDALRDAFARYPSMSRSLGSVGALEVARGELADPVSDRVIEVLILATERGGSVVRTILEDLAASITADLRVLDELDTEILESRINARAVVVLPWIALVMLNQGGGPFREFYQSGPGVAVIALGAILTGIGSIIIARLARVPVEARVFVAPVTQ